MYSDPLFFVFYCFETHQNIACEQSSQLSCSLGIKPMVLRGLNMQSIVRLAKVARYQTIG